MSFWKKASSILTSKPSPPEDETRSDGQGPDARIHDEGEGLSISGERGISSVSRARSLQSRVSHVLALGLIGALSLGLLGWYYAKMFSRQSEAKRSAQTASRNQAAGDMPLPSLGEIEPPKPTIGSMLGEAPEEPPPDDIPDAWLEPARDPAREPGLASQPLPKSPEELALERRLLGPAFSRSTHSGGTPASTDVALSAVATDLSDENTNLSTTSTLETALKPSRTPAVRAKVLPTQRLLLPKGAFVDCTLETAIDSTLPGMTTCITATDTFGVDGSTVLMERGTKLVGETRGEVKQGQARVFVVWAEARTPTGVVIPLASPGTDELGRSGLAGRVNRHFFERFGAAILISVIDGAVQGAVAAQREGEGAVIYNPSASQDIMTEVLKSTVNIPPTVTKNQGDRIQVLVARDLDFRSVYELRPAASGR